MKFLKTNIIPILCAIALIALALPICTYTVEVNSAYLGNGSSSTKISGYSCLKSSLLTILLIAGPILLVAMNYIKQLEKYVSLLAIAVPVGLIVCMILVFLSAKGYAVKASGGGGEYSVDMSFKVGFGMILGILSYLGMIVAGAVKYHNFTLDKAGLEKLKNGGAELLNATKEKVSSVAGSVSSVSGAQTSDGTPRASAESVPHTSAENVSHAPAARPVRKAAAMSQSETLDLIERLSKMHEAGILTDEEFSAKKKELLLEI